MFDLPECAALGKLGAQIYQSGGIVSAVCHGTVGEFTIYMYVSVHVWVIGSFVLDTTSRLA